jgi:hypothetical protein
VVEAQLHQKAGAAVSTSNLSRSLASLKGEFTKTASTGVLNESSTTKGFSASLAESACRASNIHVPSFPETVPSWTWLCLKTRKDRLQEFSDALVRRSERFIVA